MHTYLGARRNRGLELGVGHFYQTLPGRLEPKTSEINKLPETLCVTNNENKHLKSEKLQFTRIFQHNRNEAYSINKAKPYQSLRGYQDQKKNRINFSLDFSRSTEYPASVSLPRSPFLKGGESTVEFPEPNRGLIRGSRTAYPMSLLRKIVGL